MAKFLSDTGLQTVWSKIDSLFLRKTSVDTVPTSGSSNPISSGGMYSVLEELEDVVAASENSLNNRLTTIEGMNLVTGTGLTADKIVLGNGNSTVKTSSKGITTTAPSSSSTDNDIPTSAAVNSAISSALGTVAGALKYKGTVASNSALPANHSVGDVYVVSTAGTFVGKACEVGDYIVCNTSGTAANNAHWDVLNGENQVSNASASLAAAGQSATIATVDGTNITVTTPSTWTGLAKTGTVTSVGMTVPTGLSVSGSPITGSGTLAVSFASGYSIPTTAKQGNWDTAYGWGNHASAGYVKLDPGAAEQTIKSSISSMSKGVVNLWRSSGDHYTFLGFSNGTTETALGGIGFKSQADHDLYKKDGSNYYKILDENNYTAYVNTTNFPGLNKTGTVTSVTPGTGLRNGTATTAITTSGTLNLITAATGEIGGIKASNVLTSAVTLTSGNGSTASRYYGVQVDNAGKAFVNIPWTDTNTKVTQTATASSNTSFRPLLLGYSYSDATVFAPSTTTDTTYATHLAKFKPSTGDLYVVGLRKLGTDGKVVTGSDTTVWNTNGGTTSNVLTGSNYNSSTYADTTPTQNSTKLITSGGIYSALDEIESVVAASEDALNTRVTTLENNTITGSGLTADKIVLGNGTRTVKTSSKGITTTAPSSSSDDTTIPTSKAVNSAIASHAGVDKTGTVTSVTLTQGTGITVSSSGTAITGSGSRTISLASVSGLTAGTYTSVTVDTYGRVTAGTNPATTDIRFADYFGESTTPASTVKKTTTNNSKSLASGDLVTGLSAIIYHQYANSGASATLNVGGSGDKAMYNAAGTRISGSTGTWTAKDIIRWIYDASLNSGSGGWKISTILGNGDSHKLRLLTGRTPLYSETYQGTVTSVATGAGLTGGTITGTGTIKANLNSETSLGTIGTTSKLYAVGVDSAGKLCVNVPWEAGTTSVSNKAATIGTSLTTIATIAGTDITAKIGSYASSSHSHAFSAITSKPTTVSGYGITDAVTNIKHQIRLGANAGLTRNLKDSSWTDISYSPSSGVSTINAVPVYREDAQWGDWVFFWKGVGDDHNSNNTKGGMLWKNGEWVLQGNLHLTNTLAFCQANTQTIGELSGGVIGASFYADNNGGGDTNSSAFYINVSTAAGGWNTHETFRFTKDGIYAYTASGRTGITGWFINESDALTTSEIDTILANAT